MRSLLAVIGGFVKPGAAEAHGTRHAAFSMCEALARTDRYRGIDVFRGRAVQGDLQLPRTPPSRVFGRTALASTIERYATIYVANGEQVNATPHVLRPAHDFAPVVCTIGTAHVNGQWMHLLVGLASGAIRPTDAFIFKSRAAERLFDETWTSWSHRFGFAPRSMPLRTVIPNGVDVTVNQRSDQHRQAMRALLRVEDDDVIFLSFSRLSPATKGDQLALVARWREVLARQPRSILVLAGAVVDRPFVAELRQLARAAGVAAAVIILDNPFEIAVDAGRRLMSAADVFLHLSTGVEETSSLVVHEAMAHGLPIIAAAWAGLPEVVLEGETGFLIPTGHTPVTPAHAASLFGDLSLVHTTIASGLVALAWDRFFAAVTQLNDRALRHRQGARARAHAEANSIETIARSYVRFFDDTTIEAERAWTGPVTFAPLIDLDRVLAAQAGGAIDPSRKVRLLNPACMNLLRPGLSAGAQGRLRDVDAAFATAAEMPVAELMVLLTPDDDAAFAGAASESAGHLLVRLLNFGVLGFVDQPAHS
jgi:glycosyltransferase involved in cell wall biosynthesis